MRDIPAGVRRGITWSVYPVSSFRNSPSVGTICVCVTRVVLRSVPCLGNCFVGGFGCCSVSLDNG
jgi:hypothetical protein